MFNKIPIFEKFIKRRAENRFNYQQNYHYKKKFISFLIISILAFSLLGGIYFLNISFTSSIQTSPSVYSHRILLSSSSIQTNHFGLNFSTYFGGNSSDFGSSIAVDSAGNSYVTGSTSSSNFPTKNAYNATYGGAYDAFITKFNSIGGLVFSTYLGGSGYDTGSSIAVDSLGNSYITGNTGSSNFPILDAYNSSYGGHENAFVAKFTVNGILVFSVYLVLIVYPNLGYSGRSDSDSGRSIAIDNAGNSYISGDGYMADNSNIAYGFVAKFNSTGALETSFILSGNGYIDSSGISTDNNGNSYITGSTSSSNFPTKNAFNATYGGNSDAFITKLSITLVNNSSLSPLSLSNEIFIIGISGIFVMLIVIGLIMILYFRKKNISNQ